MLRTSSDCAQDHYLHVLWLQVIGPSYVLSRKESRRTYCQKKALEKNDYEVGSWNYPPSMLMKTFTSFKQKNPSEFDDFIGRSMHVLFCASSSHYDGIPVSFGRLP